MTVRILADATELAQEAAKLTAEAAAEAIAERGAFHLVLAGGTTPRLCYELLRDMDIDWSRVHIWFGDERCLPVGHAERNDRMADEALLAHVPIPAAQIHRMPAELGPDEGAARYARTVDGIRFDMVHLGMGEDGHTASLFPGNPALNDPRPVVPVFDSPKPPPERVSLSLPILQQARQRLILVAGSGKAPALQRIEAGEALPVSMVGEALWLLNAEAAGVATRPA